MIDEASEPKDQRVPVMMRTSELRGIGDWRRDQPSQREAAQIVSSSIKKVALTTGAPEPSGVGKLIAESHGTISAEAYHAFEPSGSDLTDLAEVGRKLLIAFPKLPAACLMMSALYAAGLRAVTKAPVYVVAGSLSIKGERIFGEDSDIDGSVRFSKSNPSWNGHAWLIFGSRLADVSIFRTAYSRESPPRLAAHVLDEFGVGCGLLICKIDDAVKSGLSYIPEYVLSDEQAASLARGALSFLSR
jgi:hypothetical protein